MPMTRPPAPEPGEIVEADCFIPLRRMRPESIDLAYVDPPFATQRSWHRAGRSFVDSWESMKEYEEFIQTRISPLAIMLKRSGAIYVHSDTTACHRVRKILDAVMGPDNFRAQIVWTRSVAHADAVGFGKCHDVILFYAASAAHRPNKITVPYTAHFLEERFRYRDPDGRRFAVDNLNLRSARAGGGYDYEYRGYRNTWICPRSTMERYDREGRLYIAGTIGLHKKFYLDESRGMPVGDVWTDIPGIRGMAEERQGYPTQKPLALIERIIEASCPPGGIILDPMCGSGTALAAAKRTGRQYMGIDISPEAVHLARARLKAEPERLL